MANLVYPEGLVHFANGDFDWTNDTIYIQLVRTTGTQTGPYYTYAATDDALDDIPNNADCRVGSPVSLTGKSVVRNGSTVELRATNPTFSAVGSGGDDDIDLLVVYKFNATESLAYLIGYCDTVGGSPLSITPNGGDVDIDFSSANDVVITF